MPFTDSSVPLYFEETGSGQPIVWVHEQGADYRTWEPQVRRFSREYRCITYNARGYPPSAVPEVDAAYTYENQRDDIIAVMDHLGIEKANVVGLSMGAYAGLQAAIAYPDRLLSLVFASGGTDATASTTGPFHALLERGLVEGVEVVADALADMRVQLREKDPRAWAEFRRHLSDRSALGQVLTARNYQGLRPPLQDFEDRLKTLNVPVLLAVGDDDVRVIPTNLFLRRTIPRSGMWMAPRTGHGLNVEEPEAFNDAVAAFLGAVERGAWG